MQRLACCHDKQASSVDSHKIKQHTQGRGEYVALARSVQSCPALPRPAVAYATQIFLQQFRSFGLGKFTFSYAAICNKKLSREIAARRKRNWNWRWALDSGSYHLEQNGKVVCAGQAHLIDWQDFRRAGFQESRRGRGWVAAATQGIIKSTFISIFHAKVAIDPLGSDSEPEPEPGPGHRACSTLILVARTTNEMRLTISGCLARH